MKYTLLKALTGQKISEHGRMGTPILAYLMLDNETGEIAIHQKFDAYLSIGAYGATNCEAKQRRTDEMRNGKYVMNYYLKPTDGKKITEYLFSVV